MVTFWRLSQQSSLMQHSDLASIKYSEMKEPCLCPASWSSICWQQPFDSQDRGQDSCLHCNIYVCVCESVCVCLWVSLCDLVYCHWPPGTSRQLAGTELKKLQDLSFWKPSLSPLPHDTFCFVSFVFGARLDVPQVHNFKEHCKTKGEE